MALFPLAEMSNGMARNNTEYLYHIEAMGIGTRPLPDTTVQNFFNSSLF